MKLPFYKMTGSGNDFIIIDNRQKIVDSDNCKTLVRAACRRKYSVGADGLILIENDHEVDFKWRFFNADGSEAEMCGNGGRCAARFVILNNIVEEHKIAFRTGAGVIHAETRGEKVSPVEVENVIYKIDGVKEDQLGSSQGYGKIEFAYYKMAVQSGINMMPSKLYQENGREHFLTERFDRTDGEKLHMQTLCGIAEMDYNNPFENSYEQAFSIMNRLNLDFDEIEQQFRRMVFNVIARNMDDHTKNISFLMDKNGKWSLSPAYDVTFAYNKNNYWLKQHQMSVGGKRNEINYQDVMVLGKELGIRNRKKIIKEVIEGVSNWSLIADVLNIPKEKIKYIEGNLLYKEFDL